MNACPSCSQPISPNDLACPNCGISLNPGTATAGPTAGGAAKGPSVAVIVGVAIVGIVLLVGCLGTVAWFIAPMPVMGPASPTSATPVPLTPSYVVPIEEKTESPATDAPQSQPPAEQAIPDKADDAP
jgi:hypothetical protein